MKGFKKIKLKTPELRVRQNRMTQADLAKQAHLSPATISLLESGRSRRIELETIVKLCIALDCQPGDLFELSDVAEESSLAAQKAAIRELLGQIAYSRPILPDQVDADLAEILRQEFPPNHDPG